MLLVLVGLTGDTGTFHTFDQGTLSEQVQHDQRSQDQQTTGITCGRLISSLGGVISVQRGGNFYDIGEKDIGLTGIEQVGVEHVGAMGGGQHPPAADADVAHGGEE